MAKVADDIIIFSWIKQMFLMFLVIKRFSIAPKKAACAKFDL
jgi:hypothetical protein